MKVVGITGKAGSGKDTLADIFQKVYHFERYSLAAPLKRGLCAMLDLDPGVFERRDLKEKPIPWIGKSPRYLAQTIGTEWGRQLINDRLWLACADQFIQKARAAGVPGVVIPDVRFSNEAYWIRDANPFFFGRLLHVRRGLGYTLDNATHASEKGVAYLPAGGDFLIHNDGGIDDLHSRVASAMRSWGWL